MRKFVRQGGGQFVVIRRGNHGGGEYNNRVAETERNRSGNAARAQDAHG